MQSIPISCNINTFYLFLVLPVAMQRYFAILFPFVHIFIDVREDAAKAGGEAKTPEMDYYALIFFYIND